MIEFKNVSKYFGEKQVLHNINTQFEEGKVNLIIGRSGSGKTVMLAGLGDLYTYPDEEGYFLSPKNFGTAAYVAEKIERMRKGEWPAATAGDEMQGLDWMLERKEPGARRPPEKICEVSFLDFAGEVYRTAFGIGAGDASLAEQAEELKMYGYKVEITGESKCRTVTATKENAK